EKASVSKTSKSKTKVAKKVESTAPKVTEAPKTQPKSESDFGDKFTWVFNNWRNIWDAFVLNIGTLILVWLIPAVAFIIALIVGGTAILGGLSISDNSAITGSSLAIAGILLLVAVAVSLLFAPALTIIQLESVRNNKVSFKDVWDKNLQFVVRFILLYLLIGAVIALPILVSILLMFVFVGFILLPLAIVFAIAVGFFTALAPYLLIDKNLGVSEALNQGYLVAKQNWQWLVVIILVNLIVSFATSLVANIIPIIGPIFSLVVSIAMMFVTAFVYVKQIAKD
ncbi:hypothetical protein KA025_01260, partial [Candidatus Saccharibacteria bacterium]|nr:hypothetical protein [Candidatus Saccharibacteria bacterium]